jgi:hypothetical protein
MSADVSAPNERITVTAGDDNQLSFELDENVSAWTDTTFTIWESTDNGVTPTGDPLVELDEADGIAITPGDMSTVVVTIPEEYTATRGAIRYYQFYSRIDELKTTLLRGALDAT